MEIFVVRHGETDYNRLEKYSGITDIPLNKRGILQAHELANRLRGKVFDSIISSPMLRTRQTADILCSALDTTYTCDLLLKERSLGVYEGLTKEDVMLKYPLLWSRQCTINPDDAPDGGETAREVCLRVKNVLSKLFYCYEGKTILLITHGFLSRAIHRFCLKLKIEELRNFTLGNCELAVYTIADIDSYQDL